VILPLIKVLKAMQYQIFVESRFSEGETKPTARHFVASVIGMPTVSVDGDTEVEAIANVKAALNLQLSKGKVVTIYVPQRFANDLDESQEIGIEPIPTMQHAGILETDPTFDDWTEKLADIRRSANQIDDEA
jgi:predicted RNase H-like HicB family nuclease